MEIVERNVADIAADHHSGAAEITAQANETLRILMREADVASVQAFQAQIQEVARNLVAAQPSMAPLVNLTNDLLHEIDGCSNVEKIREMGLDFLEGQAQASSRSQAELVAAGIGLIESGFHILTHSRSSTVLALFRQAHAAGIPFVVTCTESRPLYEGRDLARSLTQVGIKVELVVDAGAFELLDDLDLILIGADSVSAEGVVNKIGSRGLAWAAKAEHVPFQVVCTTFKFLPEGYKQGVTIEAQDPDEVWKEVPTGVDIVNRYFDLTPLETVTGIVTERGRLSRQEVKRQIRSAKVHPALQEIGKEAT